MKKSVVILLTILLIFISATAVFAEDKMNLNLSKSEVNKGEEVIVSINFDTSETSSLSSYTAKLKYDKDVFEDIKEEDFQEQENWADIKYSNYDSKFSLIKKSDETTQKQINIKLKVKENAKSGDTNVTLYSASATDGENSILLDDVSQKINIIGDENDIILESEEKNLSTRN